MQYEIWQQCKVITMIPLLGLMSVRVRFGGVSLSLYPDCGQRRSYFIPSKNKTAHERSKKAQGTPVAQWNEANCSSFISGFGLPSVHQLSLGYPLILCIEAKYNFLKEPYKLLLSSFLCLFVLFCLEILEVSIVVISLIPLLPILISPFLRSERLLGLHRPQQHL